MFRRSRLWHKVHQAVVRLGFQRDWFLIPLAALVGALAGLSAQGYGQLVRLSERFFGGLLRQSQGWSYIWLLVMIAVLPAVGGLAVGLIKYFFKLPTISHGIPEVVESMARHRGRMRLRSAVFTALNSALTLGSGGSSGQEGPIVHIGSVVGSQVGQVLKVNREYMNTLIGCGAAAGLGAIFNAPIAGVLFALEVMLRDFSFRTFVPVVVAAVIGVTVNQALSHNFGALFALQASMNFHFTLPELIPYLLLSVVCGGVASLFTFSLSKLEHTWINLQFSKPFKPMLGGLAVGVMGVGLLLLYPHAMPSYGLPAFFGNGYRVVENLLNPLSYAAGTVPGIASGTVSIGSGVGLVLGFVLLAMVGKIVGTSISLGSGGAGGIFAPALFIGAAAGSAFGLALRATHLFPDVGPAAYALAGMAGVLAGVVHCPLTAFILVFEITRDYSVILPIMLVAMSATTIAKLFTPYSVYVEVLRERGIHLGSFADYALLRRMHVADVPLVRTGRLRPEDPAQLLVELAQHKTDSNDYPVTDQLQRYQGMVVNDDLRVALLAPEALPVLIVSELMRTDMALVSREDNLEQVLHKFNQNDVDSLPVVNGDHRLLGVITRASLMRHYQKALEEG